MLSRFDADADREKKKLVEETTVPIIVPNANRFGTGEAVIDAVNFYNRHGEPIAALNNGEGIVIEIAYSLNSPLPDMAIGAGIYTHSDVKCFEAAIPSLRTSYGYFSHNSSLRCYLKALPLLPGRYYVNVGLYPTDWSFVYDYHWQMHPLDVKSTKNKDSDVYVSGIIALDHSWLLTSEGNPRNPDEN